MDWMCSLLAILEDTSEEECGGADIYGFAAHITYLHTPWKQLIFTKQSLSKGHTGTYFNCLCKHFSTVFIVIVT